MSDRIKQMVNTYVYVTTGVLFATAMFITVFNRNADLDVLLLWQILRTSLFCVLGNLLYPLDRELSHRQLRIRRVLHYFYINLVVFGSAVVFDWYDITDLVKTIFMICCITVIFCAVSWTSWYHSRRMSESMNRELEKYRHKKLAYLSSQEKEEGLE